MKKLLLIPVLLFAITGIAENYSYEITPLVGYNVAEGELGFKNDYAVGGLQFQYNNKDWLLSPELSLLYSQNLDYVYSNLTTKMTRGAINGVYEYDTQSMITPFAKIGGGMEILSPKKLYGNEDSPFADVGAGTKIHFTDHIALKLEALYMLKYNNARYDSNAVFSAGINIAFGGGKSKQETHVTAPTQKPQNNKTQDLKNSVSIIQNISATQTQTQAENLNLHIKFETNSYSLDEKSKKEIKKFAQILKSNLSHNIQITGYADSLGEAIENQYLSEKRANIVKNMLITEGVPSYRLSAIGKGENNSIASNITEEGRAQNRRTVIKVTNEKQK
jgi:OOP family OmpA-OmpF porin